MDETEQLRKRVGGAVAAWMKRARLGPTAIYHQTGVARETIHAVRDGRRLPSLDVLSTIAPLLGTTAGVLVDGIMPPEQSIGLTPLDYRRFERVEERVAQILPLADHIEEIRSAFRELVGEIELPQDLARSLRARLEFVVADQS